MARNIRRLMRYTCLFILVAALSIAAAAQKQLTPNTLTLAEGASRPKASVNDVAWITGHWQGTGLGGVSEEYWAPPMGNAMLGMYRLVKSDGVAFYEILTIAEDAGSIVLRLKHFNPDLTGWEEKAKTVDFRLVKLGKNEAWFDGLTFKRTGDLMTIYLVIKQKDGTNREEKFEHRLVGSMVR